MLSARCLQRGASAPIIGHGATVDTRRGAASFARSACEKADFTFLLNLTGLTKGNLSSHLSKLEEAGLVRIEKQFEGKQPVTYIMLTPQGREGLQEHWERLDAIRRAARRLKPLRST